MLRRLRPRSAYDLVAVLALIIAVGTGGAYAANTIGSADVIDESLLSQDIKNDTIQKDDLGPDSVGTGKIKDGVVATSDLAPDAVTGAKVLDNSLGGADIQESTLGAVPDADALGGVAAAGYQRRGIWAIAKSVTEGHGDGAGTFGDVGITLSCLTRGKVSLLLFNRSGGPATLNWVYHDGTAMQASGNSLSDTSPGNVQSVDSVGNRIEGQFILAGPSSVTTANLHALHLGTAGCELTGTAVKAAR
jgi:hypothetical protein